jgi:hypothetical protein
MYIFRIELRSLLFGWNALVAQCNRKQAWRSIPFCATDYTDICVIYGYKNLQELRLELDIILQAIIITVFYATPSMPYDCFPRVVKHATILRTKHRLGAKSTPNTPYNLQERK